VKVWVVEVVIEAIVRNTWWCRRVLQCSWP
jgi:hypothetical protein